MNVISRLTSQLISNILDNDNLCRLLYYDTSDCLSLPMDDDKKDELLYGKLLEDGTRDKSTKRIHKTTFNPDIINDVRSEIRIYNSFNPQYRCLAKVNFFVEIIVHQDIWDLEIGDRANEILFEFKKILNQKNIEAIGTLNLDDKSIANIHFGKEFNGFMLVCSSRIQW